MCFKQNDLSLTLPKVLFLSKLSLTLDFGVSFFLVLRIVHLFRGLHGKASVRDLLILLSPFVFIFYCEALCDDRPTK